MKSFLVIFVLTMTISLQVGAQDIRSKVGPSSESSFTNIIDPDSGVYGTQWGSSEDEFIKNFGHPTGYIRLNGAETAMLYGKEHAFIFTASKLSGVRINRHLFDWKLSNSVPSQNRFDAISWQLPNGIRQQMNLADIKKILGEGLKTDRNRQRYFSTDKTSVELDFTHYPREGENDEAYKLVGIYIRQATLGATQNAPVLERGSKAQLLVATKPYTSEEANWWQEVRAVGKQYADAVRRKNEFVHEAFRPPGRQISRIEYEARASLGGELAKLKAEALSVRTRYMSIIREGEAKGYRASIRDVSSPIILYKDWPQYTEEARHKKVKGKVILRVEFRSDGAIGEVKVMSGLGYGLDEEAAARMQDIVFLPAVEGGKFTTRITPVTVSFEIR